VPYKILAKALALSLQYILTHIIRLYKMRFIRGHFTLNNVVVIWEGMEWDKCLGLKALLIKFDFEKAYDC
jgi:hypothetical protein